jgi:ABC-type multidrug transport system ATPase subunit
MCYAKLIGITDREHVVNSTLRKFHMESFANRVIRTYSGGMRRYDKNEEMIFQD